MSHGDAPGQLAQSAKLGRVTGVDEREHPVAREARRVLDANPQQQDAGRGSRQLTGAARQQDQIQATLLGRSFEHVDGEPLSRDGAARQEADLAAGSGVDAEEPVGLDLPLVCDVGQERGGGCQTEP